MRVNRPLSLALVGAVALSSIAASPPPPLAKADSTGVPAAHAGHATSDDVARRASELHERGMEAGAAGKWRRAATLHQRASGLRGEDDPRRTKCLEIAANLLYADGDLAAAQQTLESAAAQSLARGDVVAAAESYLNAGLVARDLRDPVAAADLTRRARLLANSPQLSDAQRGGILQRILPR
jgi:tetratricopeptide (TPR) repeat protein